MSKRRIEGTILAYFESEPLDKVDLMLTLVKSVVAKRKPRKTRSSKLKSVPTSQGVA